MKKLIFFAFLIFLSAFAFALNEDFSNLRALMNSYFSSDGLLNIAGEHQIQYANTYVSQIPEPIRAVFGNETINIEILFNDNSKEILGIQTKDAQIIAAQKKPFSKPTMTVFVSEKSIKKILSNDNRIKGFIQAYSSGEIKYEAVGFVPNVQKNIVDTIISILRFFNLFGTGKFLLPHS